MVDIADRAQNVEEFERAMSVKRATWKQSQSSADVCYCGRKIPQIRQETLPGVQTCVICQEQIERQSNRGQK